MQETWVQSLGREDPLEKEMAPHSRTLAWKIPWRRCLVGYSPWGHKESDTNTTELLHFHFLSKGGPKYILGFPDSSVGKESACTAGDPGLIPGWGRSLGEGNGYPLQYSCLKNSMDRGASKAAVHGVAKSQTWLSNFPVHLYVIANKTKL